MIDVHERSGIHCVRVRGARFEGNDPSFVETVTSLLENRGARIVIDLAEVQFINSTGLGDLVTLTAQANVQESHVVLAAPSAFVAGVLETTKLDRFLRVCPTVDAAIATLTA